MMGSTTLVLVFCIFLGSIIAIPEELRSNFEFLDGTNLDEPKYRLLDSVQPTDVFVDLDVYLEEFRFDGNVKLIVQVRENLTQIVMHQNVVKIDKVSVYDANDQPVILQTPTPFETDEYFELLLINFYKPIPPGNYTITISYSGIINLNPIDRGFYRGYYYLGEEKRLYATTQFQPYHARAAFPCFDEPQFKSRYVLSITRDANLSPSYSNMGIDYREDLSNGRVRETFLRTPLIPSYLIAFHVSDFEETNTTSTPTKLFKIISRPGVTNQHQYAAEIGIKITNELDDYLGIDFYDMGQGQVMKNDHIALPDFPSGAMENWGMVNYREAYLLYDEENTNVQNKIFTATIIAHELAHKWFGNLVTCFWWSNVWLNESFASFFEYFIAHAVDPDLELDEQFIIDSVQSALSSDASASVASMNNSAVANNPSISAHFSTTSYAKGASVLRMLEHFVGKRTFKVALKYYLRANSYSIGTPEAMYNAFRRATSEDLEFTRIYPDVDIGEIFDSWVQNPGSPVLNVDFDMATGVITITQERFQLGGEAAPQLWHIPITWTQGGSADFSNTRPSMILSTKSATINATSGHNWVMFNIAQSGLYRVNYDDHNWEMIGSYLRNNRLAVHKMNRAQIVNDILFFIRAGKISMHRAFDVLTFLKDETDYYVWAAALTQIDWIRRRMEHMPAVHNEFTNFLLQVIEETIDTLGYDERSTDSTSTILNRMQIMNFACNLGHEGCITDSLEKWNQFKNNNSYTVPVNLRRYVYCTGLREGDESDYKILFAKYNRSEHAADMVVMLRALACTKNTASIQHYLGQSMHNDRIRVHDRTNAFNFALQGNRENLKVVLQFLYDNFEEIDTTYGGRLSSVISAVSSYLTDFKDIEEFQKWAYANQIALGNSFSTAASVPDIAIANLEWGNAAAVDLYSELQARASAPAITTSTILLFLAFIAHYLH